MSAARTPDWYDRHAADYDRVERGLNGEIEFYAALARASEPPVLELACGTGRVALAVARLGVPVVGLDRSAAMLAVARAHTSGPDPVRWVEADMRSFDLNERFGLICIPFRSFLHLLTTADQRATLASCRRHLLPSGRLALNIINPEPALRAAAAFPARHRRGERHRPPALGEERGRAVLGSGYGGTPIRYVTPEELRGLLEGSGFIVDALYGWFDLRRFERDSPEQVWLARRVD